MNLQRARRFLHENLIFYLAGFLVVLGIKYYYSQAECDTLLWILAPTTRLVELLSGIPFTYVSGTGYVNHSLRLLIAPSCSGVRFMITTIAMLVFSFVHIVASPKRVALLKSVPFSKDATLPEDVLSPKDATLPKRFPCTKCTVFSKNIPFTKDTTLTQDVPYSEDAMPPKAVLSLQDTPVIGFVQRVGRGAGWIIACVVFSWLFTVLVNGLRIIVAIYLPLYLERAGFMGGVLTPDRLHTMIGVAVYFSALLTLYRRVGFLLQGKPGQTGRFRYISPLFWYFLMTLGLPLLNQAYVKDTAQFKEFAVLVICCMALILLPYCMTGLWHSVKRSQE